MQAKNGLYLYAPSSIFSKIKTYIDEKFDTINTYGTSHVDFFTKDFFAKVSERNLKSVVIVSTSTVTPQALEEYAVIVQQINLLQSISADKLIVTVLYHDDKILGAFNPLRQYVDLSTAEIGNDGLQNYIIDKIIIAPVIKNSAQYVEYVPSLGSPMDIQHANPAILHEILPVKKAESIHQVDVSHQFEADADFTNTLKSIQDDLKNMELRMDVGEWTSQELQDALDSLDNNNTVGNLDSILSKRKNSQIEAIDKKIEHTNLELNRYEKIYSTTKDDSLSERVNNLSIYKDGLLEVRELCNVQSKVSFYEALQSELVTQGDKSMEDFKSSLADIKNLENIRDSQEKIAQLKLKRMELQKSIRTFQEKFQSRFVMIDSELNSQEKLLISQATTRRDDLRLLQEESRLAKNEKLNAQYNLDRESLIVLTNEITTIQNSKKTFALKCKEAIQGYKMIVGQLQQVIGLDTVLIKEQDNLIDKLMSTKTVQVVAKDLLGSKLETFIGPQGVGVTTVAVNYAYTSSTGNKSVCIIDLDTETPELHRYLDCIPVIQDLAGFVNMETSIDGLSGLKTYNGSAYISNPLSNNSILFNLEDCDNIQDMFTNVLDKLNILARVFDKIIVIAPTELDGTVVDLYKASGKWFYVTDLNPTNIDNISMLFEELKKKDVSKYYKFVLNKYINVDTSLISSRLGITSVFSPLLISHSQNLVTSKLNGTIACSQYQNLTKQFNFK